MNRKIQIKKVDALFSLYIRSRDNWTCQRCGAYHEPPTTALHCSHFWGRGNKSTRFDPQNAEALCYGCHQLWEGNKMGAYRELKIKQLGEEGYQALEVVARTATKIDETLIYMGLQQLMKELIETTDQPAWVYGRVKAFGIKL